MGEVKQLLNWEVHEFPWGAAIWDRGGKKWTSLTMKPSNQAINLEDIKVELHENGIEFLS